MAAPFPSHQRARCNCAVVGAQPSMRFYCVGWFFFETMRTSSWTSSQPFLTCFSPFWIVSGWRAATMHANAIPNPPPFFMRNAVSQITRLLLTSCPSPSKTKKTFSQSLFRYRFRCVGCEWSVPALGFLKLCCALAPTSTTRSLLPSPPPFFCSRVPNTLLPRVLAHAHQVVNMMLFYAPTTQKTLRRVVLREVLYCTDV